MNTNAHFLLLGGVVMAAIAWQLELHFHLQPVFISIVCHLCMTPFARFHLLLPVKLTGTINIVESGVKEQYANFILLFHYYLKGSVVFKCFK